MVKTAQCEEIKICRTESAPRFGMPATGGEKERREPEMGPRLYVAANSLRTRLFVGFGSFFRRMRSRLRTSCSLRLGSRLGMGCRRRLRSGLRTSCLRFRSRLCMSHGHGTSRRFLLRFSRWANRRLGMRCCRRTGCRLRVSCRLFLLRGRWSRLRFYRLILIRASCGCFILSCFVLGCLVFGSLALSRFVFGGFILGCLALSCLVFGSLILGGLALGCLSLGCLAFGCLAFSCLVFGGLTLSCRVLGCSALGCHHTLAGELSRFGRLRRLPASHGSRTPGARGWNWQLARAGSALR